jgi:hypothetical protein
MVFAVLVGLIWYCNHGIPAIVNSDLVRVDIPAMIEQTFRDLVEAGRR